MKYFLRNNNIDFLHRHCGYRKSLIEISAHFKNSGRMKSNVAIREIPDNYEDGARELYKIVFRKYPEKQFEKIYS